MADEEQAPEPAPEKPRNALVAKAAGAAGTFVLMLLAVVIGGLVDARLHPQQELIVGPDGQLTLKPEEKHEAAQAKEAAPATGPAIYFALDPPLVVNFEQDGVVRFLQVTVEVLARDQAVITAVQQSEPLIRNNLMLLMSNLDYAQVMTREGKEKLRAAALAEVKSIVKRETGKSGPESLLFTGFVVQ
jgi:flagellar FliL protein